MIGWQRTRTSIPDPLGQEDFTPRVELGLIVDDWPENPEAQVGRVCRRHENRTSRRAPRFVTSANFTEWAQQRNVEAGVMIRDAQFTHRLRAQFDALVESKAVRRLAGF
jgi:phosphatidylserine/phosphatidylglycerophosphate/cardiolipin synthase-like enzyme